MAHNVCNKGLENKSFTFLYNVVRAFTAYIKLWIIECTCTYTNDCLIEVIIFVNK